MHACHFSVSPSKIWILNNDRLIAIDEFHHVSASDNNVLGRQLNAFLTRDNAHIVAMTGSYFRGDAAPVLNPEDEHPLR